MLYNKSKGQVGVFVVIGAILVIGLIFIISISFDDIPLFTDEKTTYNIKEFVESCLLIETETAVNKLGNSGGWLYHQPMIFTDRKANKNLNKVATGLNFLEKNEMPYWYFYNDKDEIFETNIPEYDSDVEYSIKNQIKRYIDEHLENNCIQSFRSFKDKYDVKYEPREVQSSVRLLDKEIVVDLELKLEVFDLNNEDVDILESFRIKTENKIYIPYNLAKEIVKAEANTSFMETRVMQILRPYQSSNSRDLLPPQIQTKMKFDFEPWNIMEVEKLAKNILSSEISRVQFLNTDYTQRKTPDSLGNNDFVKNLNGLYLKDYISESSNLDETDKKLFNSFKSFKVTPTFEPFFPLFFRIKQALGDAILLPKPEMVAGFLPIYYTEYKASYELAGPILFAIKSNDINDKFNFYLPIEFNIKHNTALKNNYNVKVDPNAIKKPTKSLICDQSQAVSGIYHFNLTDPINFGNREYKGPEIGVEDAMVKFTCKNFVTCFIGKTSLIKNEKIENASSTNLQFRLPTNCDPGKIEIRKYGHKIITIEDVNPVSSEDVDLGVLELPSGKTFKMKTGIMTAGSGSSVFSKSFNSHEKGFLIFEHLEDETLIKVVEITRENQHNLSVELYPGTYKIFGIITYDEKFIIPEEKVCYKTGWLGGEDCKTIPQTNMTSWITGGYELGVWNVTTESVLKYNVVRLNFIKYDIPKNYDELGKIGKLMGELKKYTIAPRFFSE